MARTQLVTLALALATTLVAAGCGGSSKTTSTQQPTQATTTSASSSSTTATQPTTQSAANVSPANAAFVAKGDAICAHYNAVLRSPAYTIKSPRDYARVLVPTATYEQAEATALGKLTPPASMAKDWTLIVTDTHTLAEDSAKLGNYAIAHKMASANPLINSADTIHEQLVAAAKRNGYKYCSLL